MIEISVKGKKIKLFTGDIALLDVEAIVNSSIKSLILGGGVARSIRYYGGPSIQEACKRIGPVEVGDAVITPGGNLKAKYVIHAVGPVYGEGDEDKKLARATLACLKIARKKKMRVIAFPAISAGIHRFPIKRCSEIMLRVTLEFLEKNDFPKEIIFCLHKEKTYLTFENTLQKFEGKR